eukprot:COSAG04_NODE_169_length_21636_cov_32.919023_8_plen_160_part_00
MDSTDLSLQDWLFSIRRRQYDRDDFIPTLHPDACPKNVLNIFEGLAIQHKDCKEADVHDCKSLLKFMKDSLFDGNDAHLNFYLKWLAKPLQAIEHGRVGDVKTRVDVLFKGGQGKGKGLILEHIGRIYGRKYCLPMEDIAQLQGAFNKFLNEALFLALE